MTTVLKFNNKKLYVDALFFSWSVNINDEKDNIKQY